ncbi:MAG: NAD(P)-binding domain-containing protein [Deltaproteobacteria bacterium]|nr:NAD(P)-binding domain-containing protein [Deltaproteobacteria bacterium]
MRTSSTAKRFLKAVLMDRLEPLALNQEAVTRREEGVKLLLECFQTVPPGFQKTQIPEHLQPVLDYLSPCLSKLLNNSPIEECHTLFESALERIQQGIVLDKGDAKKWPSLSSEDKAVRALTNYYAGQDHRWILEKPFRELNTARHWSIALGFLKEGLFKKAEEELVWAQQELRHVIAIALGIDLIQLREDAETLAQTLGRSEREVTLELFEKALAPSALGFQQVEQKLEDLLKKYPHLNSIVRPIPEQSMPPRVVNHLMSIESVSNELLRQNENLSLVLSENHQICFDALLQKLLHVPDAKLHCYFRMPDIDRYKNVKILDAQQKLLIEFDAEGRLAQAPSVSQIQSRSHQHSEPLDVAVIGGGPGGISAGVALTSLGIYRYAIFERAEANSTVRDIWSREKEADTFYSGPPEPIEGLVGMQDTTRAVFLNRMNSFIDYFHLNLKTKEPVLEIKFENGLWQLKTSKASYQARNILMTAGRYGKPKRLVWEENAPESLAKHVVRGVEVDEIENSTVLVIGGGNSAFDNVRTLTALGTGKKNNQVYLSYFKKPFSVPASLHAHNNEQFLQWEAEKKITILWNTNTQSVEPIIENGKTRWKMTFKEPDVAPMIFDYFAPAVGWMIDKDMMEKIGVVFPEGGRGPLVDPQTHQALQTSTSGEPAPLSGLYIAGDYYLQRSVPAALTTNYRAAVAIAQQLKK